MTKKACNQYVFIDTETGGLDYTKHSLLSIGCIIWDVKVGIIAAKEFFIKHDEYVITEKATRINKFSKEQHETKALEPEIVIKSLISMLDSYFEGIAVPLIGHNVQFDINFLREFFRQNGRSYEKIFSHRAIDTYSVYKSLCLAGIIDAVIDSSAQAFKYFEIKVEKRHDALADARATVELYERILNIIKGTTSK